MTDAPLPDVSGGLGGLSFQDEITNVSASERPQSMVIFGKPKGGKTTLAASAYDIPALRGANKDVLILEGEKGTASIAKHYPNVHQVFIDSYAKLMNVVNELLTKPHNYGVIIIDTLDRFQELAVDHYLTIGAADTRGAWGDVKKWTLGLVKALHQSPMLAIFLVHQTDEKDERTGKWKSDFALSGSAKDKIGQEFDLIGHLTVRTDKEGKAVRTLQVGPTEGGITGSRWEAELGASIDNPTMPHIFALIAGETTTTTTTKE